MKWGLADKEGFEDVSRRLMNSAKKDDFFEDEQNRRDLKKFKYGVDQDYCVVGGILYIRTAKWNLFKEVFESAAIGKKFSLGTPEVTGFKPGYYAVELT